MNRDRILSGAIAFLAIAVLTPPPPAASAGRFAADCSRARAVPDRLWPPDHRFIPIEITGVLDAAGHPAAVLVTGVTQDEPAAGTEGTDLCPDALIGNVRLLLRAERSPGGNGRVYTVSFVANDGLGNLCNGSVKVCVPHDGGRTACVDDGVAYDPLGPCAPGAPPRSLRSPRP